MRFAAQILFGRSEYQAHACFDELADEMLRIHTLCFMCKVYEQRFLQLTKSLKKLSNNTSLFLNLISCLCPWFLRRKAIWYVSN